MSTTILIVDDSEDDRLLYQETLKDIDASYNLVMASTASEGFACAIDIQPDLILLDYNLPDMDGLGFMKKLAAHSNAATPIIMLTGVDNVELAVEVIKNGANDFLVKDLKGQHLRKLPGVIVRVMAANLQRKQIERLQKETQTLLLRNQFLMQNSMDGIHVMNMHGDIIEANAAFCSMMGYTREEMARLNVSDWELQWPPEEMRERFKNVIGKRIRFETVHRRKDGSQINVEISASGVEIEKQLYILAFSHDISQRKKNEEAIRESEKKFRLLFESAADCILVLDDNGCIIDINRTGHERLGYTKDEMLGKHISQFDSPDFSDNVPDRMAEIQKNGFAIFESAHVCKDGSVMPIEVNCRTVEQNGQHTFLSIIRDISERKRAEAVLRLNKTIIETASDGFWLYDTNGYLLDVNQACADTIGYKREELIGKNISQISAYSISPELVKARIKKAISHGLSFFETQHRHKDGHVIDFEVSIVYIPESKYLFSFLRNVSNRKDAEQALKQSEANLRAMLDNSPYMSWLKNTEGRYIMINKVLANKIRIKDPSEAIGKSDLDFQPKDLAEKYRSDDFDVMETRQRKHVEEFGTDGTNVYWVETYKTPIGKRRFIHPSCQPI